MKKLLTASTVLATALGLSACQTVSSVHEEGVNAQPALHSEINFVKNNSKFGDMYLRPVEGGVQVFGKLEGLTPGSTVALHIHENGSCDNMGKAAGGHFNPYNKQHGNPSSSNSHAGDLPNITADANGIASINFVKKDISVAENAQNSVYGRSFIVHAGSDDYTSQPAGNAGDRVACGIIKAY